MWGLQRERFSLPFDEQCIVFSVLCTSINKKERRKILILKTRDQLLANPSSWPVTNFFSFYVWDTFDAWPSCSNISTKVNNTYIFDTCLKQIRIDIRPNGIARTYLALSTSQIMNKNCIRFWKRVVLCYSCSVDEQKNIFLYLQL